MKFNLTITDLTMEEAQDVLNKLSTSTAPPVVHATPTPFTPDTELTHAGNDAHGVTPASTPQPAGNDVSAEPAAVSSTPNAQDNAELDANGLPWDERIHSGNQKKTAKGIWQRKRGVQDVYFDEVVAELTGATTAPAAPAQAPVTTAAPATVPPVTPAPPLPAATAQTPVAPVTRDFQGLMAKLADLFQSGTVGQDYMASVLQRINDGYGTAIQSLPDIANDPQKIEYAWSCLDIDGHGA